MYYPYIPMVLELQFGYTFYSFEKVFIYFNGLFDFKNVER